MTQSAYDRGGDAYWGGVKPLANPYVVGSEAHGLWLEGWEGAYLQDKLYSGTVARAVPPMTRVAGVLYWLAGIGLGIAIAAWLWGC